MPSSLFVRSTGEADIVALGPSNSLLYFWAMPGQPWSSFEIAGPGTTFSAPSIVVRDDGEADVVAEGPGNTLMYYWSRPGGPWSANEIAGAGTTFSPPSIFVRPDGEADVVAQGPGQSLLYHWALPGSAWTTTQVAGAGTTGYWPSIFVRPDGEADIVAQGAGDSLVYYWASPGTPWESHQVAGSGTTLSAPSIFVRADGEADIVAQGPGGSLSYYWMSPLPRPIPHPVPVAAAASGGPVAPEGMVDELGARGTWTSFEVAGPGTTFSAPAICVRPNGYAEIVAEGTGESLMYYHADPGSPWSVEEIGGSGTTISEQPSVFHRVEGEVDVVAQGPSWGPTYYWLGASGEWGSTQVARTYQFAIPQMNVVNIRSGHFGQKDAALDTDYAYLGVQAKGQPAQTATTFAGNLYTGTVPVGLKATVVAADLDLVTFQYSVINSQNPATAAVAFLEQAGSAVFSAVEKADETAIQTLAHVPLSGLNSQEAAALIGAQLGNIALPGLGAIIGAAAGWFASAIGGFGWPDCDGPVAIGLHIFSGAQLHAMTLANNGTGTSGNDDNQGTDSAHGCGSNSDYQIYWSITAPS